MMITQDKRVPVSLTSFDVWQRKALASAIISSVEPARGRRVPSKFIYFK
jgi:hypothetical protein